MWEGGLGASWLELAERLRGLQGAWGALLYVLGSAVSPGTVPISQVSLGAQRLPIGQDRPEMWPSPLIPEHSHHPKRKRRTP